MTVKIYISGPMSGMPDFNFAEFNRVEAMLLARGHEVVNPARLNPDPTATWEECMRVDIKALCDCSHIFLLHGWEKSKGAALEFHIADALGLCVLNA